jgi:hypothetical protein
MSWSNEDWLIIDSVLNSVAKSIRRIEQEERRQTKLIQQEPPEQTFSSFAGQTQRNEAA